jgi:TRAP-type C4-dicarboxylate transport system permease large subunit
MESSVAVQTNGRVDRIPFSPAGVWRALKDAGWEIPLPFLVVGGIYGGAFTATEASGVTAVYALVEVYRAVVPFLLILLGLLLVIT